MLTHIIVVQALAHRTSARDKGELTRGDAALPKSMHLNLELALAFRLRHLAVDRLVVRAQAVHTVGLHRAWLASDKDGEHAFQ